MIFFTRFFGIFLIIWISINMPLAANDKFKLVKVNHYSVEIPAGFELKDITPNMVDFQLMEIHKTGKKKPNIIVYFGNSPSFPKYDWPALNKERDLENTADWQSYREDDGAFEGVSTFHGLSYRGSSESPYTKIHYFGIGINKDSIVQFKKIISSMKVSQSKLP